VVAGALALAVAVAANAAEVPEAPPRPGFKFSLDLPDEERRQRAEGKRQEAIRQLIELIPRYDDGDPEKPDLLFQLAEFYTEAYRHQYAREERAAEAAQAPRADHRESDALRLKAVRIHEQILRDFQSYRRTDEVLFALASHLQDLGQTDEAVKRYRELIQRLGESRFVPDTHVQLGDHAFDRNDLAGARAHFSAALQSREPKIHSYALYKLAWCDYNARQYEQALKKLKDVVEYAATQGKVLVDLRQEALADLVVIYTALDRPDEAMAYFRERAPPARVPRLTARLAGALVEAGREESGIALYRALLAEDPLRPEAPVLQKSIVGALAKLGRRAQVKEEARALAELYRPGGRWWQAHAGQRAVLREGFDAAEEALRDLSADLHKEAQETRQVETYRLARDLYRQYLDAFASSEDPEWVADAAFNQAFFHGEVLWALEEWEQAAEAYDRVVRFSIPARDSAREVSTESYRKNAAFNAVLAYNKLLAAERGRREAGRAELTSVEQRLLAACDTYVRLFPGERAEIDIRYQAAILLHDRGHAEEAVKRFGEIIDRWPEDPRSERAADLTMHLLEARGAWEELARRSRQFLDNQRLARPGTPFARRVAGVVQGAQYKWIDEVIYKQQKDADRAAEEMLRYVAEFPRSAYADRALTYAMLILRDQGQLQRAVETGERVLQQYPGSPLEPKARYTLATLYEQVADLPRSAQMYESFIQSHDRQRAALEQLRKRPKAEAEQIAFQAALVEEATAWLPDAQLSAAQWWEGLGQSERAVAAYRAYRARFKDRPDAPQAQFAIGRLHAKDRRWAEAARAFEAFEAAHGRDARVKPEQLFLARAHRLEAYRALKAARQADRLQAELQKSFARLPAEARQDGAVLAAYAQARFWAVEPAWTEYAEISLRRVATLERDLDRKRRKLRDLEARYVEVVGLGVGEWGIASLVRIGLAYSDLAQNILRSPIPPGLDDEQQRLYRDGLSGLARPLEGLAAEALEKALGKAFELSIWSEWTLAAQEAFNQIRPGTYPAVRPVTYQRGEPPAADPAKAEAEARQVLARSRGNVQAYRTLAHLELDRGHHRLAELLALTALKLDEQDPASHNTLGLVALALEDRARALAHFQKAVALDPRYLAGHLNIGAMALAHRDYRAAEQAFARAIEIDAGAPRAEQLRAWALEGLRAVESGTEVEGDSGEPEGTDR
jgi:tetratricopeptide (TPR) repeat protein